MHFSFKLKPAIQFIGRALYILDSDRHSFMLQRTDDIRLDTVTIHMVGLLQEG